MRSKAGSLASLVYRTNGGAWCVCVCVCQVVRFDGGEYNMMAGEFNELENMSTEEWNMIDNIVRRQKFTQS